MKLTIHTKTFPDHESVMGKKGGSAPKGTAAPSPAATQPSPDKAAPEASPSEPVQGTQGQAPAAGEPKKYPTGVWIKSTTNLPSGTMASYTMLAHDTNAYAVMYENKGGKLDIWLSDADGKTSESYPFATDIEVAKAHVMAKLMMVK
jgi:hypothetical protein